MHPEDECDSVYASKSNAATDHETDCRLENPRSALLDKADHFEWAAKNLRRGIEVMMSQIIDHEARAKLFREAANKL